MGDYRISGSNSSEPKNCLSKVDYKAQQLKIEKTAKDERAEKADVNVAINEYFRRSDEQSYKSYRTERFNNLDSLNRKNQLLLEEFKNGGHRLPAEWTDEKVLLEMLIVDHKISPVEAILYMNQKHIEDNQ